MGPYGVTTAAQREAERDRYLQAAREAFPGWDFRPAFGGWEAVPEGVPIIRAVDLDGVVGKLREHLASEAGSRQ